MKEMTLEILSKDRRFNPGRGLKLTMLERHFEYRTIIILDWSRRGLAEIWNSYQSSRNTGSCI